MSPLLKQIFFIGDGLTGNGTGDIQQFIAPTGATRLFLNATDGFGWANNGGSHDVAVTFPDAAPVPEPGTMSLLGGGLFAAVLVRLRRR